MNTVLQTETAQWYQSMSRQIERYKELADEHWQAEIETADPMDCRALQITDVQEAEQMHQRLLAAAQTAPTLGLTPNDHQDRNTLIKIEMYRKLGLWLCSYFLGIPHPYYWEEIKELAFKLDAYPGGAFYDKLAGDVYRFERRQRLKAIAANTLRDGGQEAVSSSYSRGLKETAADIRPDSVRGIVVMAFTPLMLLPDEHDLTHTDQLLEFSCEAERIFTREVEKLACRFLRLHSWRYCNDGRGHPISYLISYDAVFEAVNEIARLNLAYRIAGEAEGDRNSLIREHVRRISGNEVTDTEKNAIDKELCDLLAASDRRIRKFYKPLRSNQKLVVLGPDVVRRRGLTSCVIGLNDAVIANRPNRAEGPTAYCEWAEGEVLAVEREKLISVLATAQKEGDCFTFDPSPETQFSSIWYGKRTPFGQTADRSDNRIRASLDSLQHAGLLTDEQVEQLLARQQNQSVDAGEILLQSENSPTTAG